MKQNVATFFLVIFSLAFMTSSMAYPQSLGADSADPTDSSSLADPSSGVPDATGADTGVAPTDSGLPGGLGDASAYPSDGGLGYPGATDSYPQASPYDTTPYAAPADASNYGYPDTGAAAPVDNVAPADSSYGYPADSSYGYPADSSYGYPGAYPADSSYGYPTADSSYPSSSYQ
jgi:hypothetical protein